MKTLHKKLFELQQEVGAISKKESNPFFKSKYFDINGLLEHLHPLLQKHELLLTQPIEGNAVFSIITDIESGDCKSSSISLPEFNDPQKMGSAITYYRRYTLQSLLALQAEDDDANKASNKQPERWLVKNSPEFEKAKQFIEQGGTIEQIKKKYKIRKEVERELV